MQISCAVLLTMHLIGWSGLLDSHAKPPPQVEEAMDTGDWKPDSQMQENVSLIVS